MVQTDLREVTKRFFVLYYPVLLIIMITNITLTHHIGFNPLGVSLAKKIFYYNANMITLFFVFIMVRKSLKCQVPWVWVFYILFTLLASELISYILRFFYLQTAVDPLKFNSYNLTMLAFLRSCNAITFLFLFYLTEKSYLSEKKFQTEQLKWLENEKKMVESQLKLLQAQIEPHFLFNTLTAVGTSYETDIETGRQMLDNFIKYLRTTLDQTRKEETTVKHEIDLITAYLDIFCIRLGERLSYKIDIPGEIERIKFPAMLIQPLVENAIKHGIEPKIEGGQIFIKAEKKGDILSFVISDTGLGLGDSNPQGMGRKIVEERLGALFGSKGKLSFQKNEPSGVRVLLEVPIE